MVACQGPQLTNKTTMHQYIALTIYGNQVGRPLAVEQKDSPSKEEIEAMHAAFCKRVVRWVCFFWYEL